MNLLLTWAELYILDRHEKLKWSHKRCCTAYIPVNIPPKNVTPCNTFSSRTTIYNTANYSIYSTTQVNYTMDGRNMTVIGKSMGPEDLPIYISFNGWNSCKV